jgi:anti-anti-sigma factor
VATTGDFDVELVPLPNGAYVVRVVGDLDMATAPTLEASLASLDSEPRVVVDLARCTFIDSAAVRMLVVAARDADAAGRSVALVATEPGILRVLEIAGVDTVLPVHSTIDDAV